jgi:Tol biopolymer transport system component
LTFNDGFDGEAVVSPDGKTVVYSSFTGSDYDLFQMNIDGSNRRRVNVDIYLL